MEKKQEVAVSILCATYNHKDFVEKVLDGYLMQKTNFPYEIVVHDDVSTDGTREILLQYQEKYPDKIRLILQEENQYSKGSPIVDFLIPQIRGKYATLCDGDDEWIYEGKLQEQYNLMESNPAISLCVHNAIQRNLETGCETYLINGLEEGIIGEREIFFATKGHVPTASFFFRTDCVKEYPQFAFEAPVGDDPLRFHCALKGDIYYIDKAWSVRNFMHIGSWNYRMKEKEKKRIYAEKFLKYLENYNEYAEGKFNESVRELMEGICEMAIHAVLPEKYGIENLREGIERIDKETGYHFTEMIWEKYQVLARTCYDYVELVLTRFVEACKQVNGKLYIYGAGLEAQKCVEILNKNQISFDGFVVSADHCKQEFYLGYKIYSINQLVEEPEKIFFWLGLNNRNRAQVSQLLKKRGYENFI